MTQWKEYIIKTKEEVALVDEVTLLAHARETGYKAIVDRTSMNTLCVVKEANQIIQHQSVLAEVQKLENYIIKKLLIMNNGLQLMIEVTERTPRKIQLFPNDYLECGARIINDYSKSRGLSVQGYATRLVCDNGLVAPSTGRKAQIFAYGTAEFATELEAQIEACLNVWVDSTEIFKKANDTEVSVKDIIEEHNFLPRKAMEEVISNLKDKETLYDIWNEYTRCIQHTVSPKIKTDGTIGLQKRANKILTTVIIK